MSVPQKRRSDWEKVHEKITDAYISLVATNGKMPTQREIAALTGVAPQTVFRHLDELTIDDFVPIHRLRFNRILHGLASAAETGDVAAAELFARFTFSWAPKQRQEITGANGGPLAIVGGQINAVLAEKTPQELKEILERAGEALAGVQGILPTDTSTEIQDEDTDTDE